MAQDIRTVIPNDLHSGPEGFVTRHPLDVGEFCTIQLGSLVLENAGAMWRDHGIAANKVAVIFAGRHSLALLDTRYGFGEEPSVTLVEDIYHTNRRSNPKPGVVELGENQPVLIGRGHMSGQLETGHMMNYPPEVSRQQCTLLLSGSQVHLFNHSPTNTTRVTGDVLLDADVVYEKRRDDRPHVGEGYLDSYTQNAEVKYGDGAQSPEVPYGYHPDGLPIIGRNSPTVRGGVYLTEHSEAVAVDHESELVRHASLEMIDIVQGMHRRERVVPTRDILQAVSDFTAQKLRYNKRATDNFVDPYLWGNGVMNLSDFLEAGIGVCRHQNLLAAALMESLIETGYLVGRSAVERNMNTREDYGHAWAVFIEAGTTEQSNMWVLDPASYNPRTAKSFVGTKLEALKKIDHNYFLSDKD